MEHVPKRDLREKRTILVVDDQPANLTIIAGILRDHYHVRISKSGEDALQQIQAGELPDLVMLDVMMPGMDGYAVLNRLKAESRTRDIPVIFVTSLDDSGEEERGFRMGAVDYLTKPVNSAIVRARVAAHLEIKDARDRLRTQNALLEEEVQQRTASLQSALREREDLLREVNHRVKNNLTVISSLLNLQASAVQTPERAMMAFNATRDRIMAMATVHRLVYESDASFELELHLFIQIIWRHLVETHNRGADDLRLEVNVRQLALPVDHAVPLGLMLNELLVNAMVHGCGGRRNGVVRVDAVVDQHLQECSITVSDDGQGFDPRQQNDTTGEAIGLILLDALSVQLQGHYRFLPGPGTTCVIQFPLPARTDGS